MLVDGSILSAEGGNIELLIDEARELQRRRRLMFAWMAALACVAAVGLIGAGRVWGVPFTETQAPSPPASVPQDVRATLASFDRSLARGDYGRACSLLDPVIGQAQVIAATTPLGVVGGCERRLAAVADVVGQSLLQVVASARIQVLFANTERHGFSASAFLSPSSFRHTPSVWREWSLFVDGAYYLDKDSGQAPTLILCLTGPRFSVHLL